MQKQGAAALSDVEYLVQLLVGLLQLLVSLALIWAAFNQNSLQRVARRYRLVRFV